MFAPYSVARWPVPRLVTRSSAMWCCSARCRPGRQGARRKALTLAEATALLDTAEADASTLGAYVVVSLLTGARTEELRALTWSHVDLIGQPDAAPPTPAHVMVWRSVRAGGDTKTRKSRRTLALPRRCVVALTAHRNRQGAACTITLATAGLT